MHLHHYTTSRLYRAAVLLATTNIGVKTLAFNMGYCNWKMFSNDFKHCNGEHPTPWRKLNKINPEAFKGIREGKVSLEGRGLIGQSLFSYGALEENELIERWTVKRLMMWDMGGNPIINYKPALKPSKARSLYIQADGQGGVKNVVVELIEGSEVFKPIIRNEYNNPVKGLSWKVEIDFQTKQYDIN